LGDASEPKHNELGACSRDHFVDVSMFEPHSSTATSDAAEELNSIARLNATEAKCAASNEDFE
jgi:hypothetical protein